jgi:hypothetical protein
MSKILRLSSLLPRLPKVAGRNPWKEIFVSTAMLVALAGSAQAQGPIDTFPAWNGTTFISSFGVVDTATYGQTITVSAGASPLTRFAFQVGNCSATVVFRGEIYAWNGTNATGPSLYESAPVTVPNSAAFQLVSFATGPINLAPGTYILFASTSKDQAGAPASSCRWGSVGNNTAYPTGQFYFLNNGPNPGQWTTSAWSTIAQDLAFQVDGLVLPVSNISSVPASSTTSLLIGLTALMGLGLFQMYRSRQSGQGF